MNYGANLNMRSKWRKLVRLHYNEVAGTRLQSYRISSDWIWRISIRPMRRKNQQKTQSMESFIFQILNAANCCTIWAHIYTYHSKNTAFNFTCQETQKYRFTVFLSFGTTKILQRSYHIHTPKRSNLEGQCGILKCFAIRKKKVCIYTYVCSWAASDRAATHKGV